MIELTARTMIAADCRRLLHCLVDVERKAAELSYERYGNRSKNGARLHMKTSRLPLLILALMALLPMASVRGAEPVRVGDLVIESPWARASIGTNRPAAAYFTITNEGQDDDHLIGLETPVAERAEVHATVNDGGVMKMLPVEDLDIKPAEKLTLEPGGLHVMLMGLRRPLKRGNSFPLTVRFEKAGSATVQVPVAGPGATEPPK